MDTHLFVGLAGYIGRPEEEGAVGVFRKSITEGTWQHVLDCNDAHVVYVHPNSANYIFAGTDDGIWRSTCLLYTSPSPRDATLSRMPSSA